MASPTTDTSVSIAYVILQYMAANETAECVESIRRFTDAPSYKIVIVDNCSPDDSYATVERLYAGAEDVVLIQTEANLGFAKGNNVGYRYALQHLRPEFVVMLNNDVLLFQPGIYAWLCDCQQRHGFAVAGPMILAADGLYTSSPMLSEATGAPADTPATKEGFAKTFRGIKLKLLLVKLHLFTPIRFLYRTFLKGVEETQGGVFYFDEHVNYRLHGSFLAFSRAYMEAFPGGLDDRTFMYGEEMFLHYHVQRAGLKLVYSPLYCVYHKEGVSTNTFSGSDVKKTVFSMQGMMKSRELYIAMLDEEPSE